MFAENVRYAANVVIERTPRSASTEWLSANRAGDLLGVSGRTVVRWIEDGRLKARRTPGGQFRLLRADVERLATEMEVQPDKSKEGQA